MSHIIVLQVMLILETCKTICGSKAEKDKLGKSKEQCESCGESACCRLHSVRVCDKCLAT